MSDYKALEAALRRQVESDLRATHQGNADYGRTEKELRKRACQLQDEKGLSYGYALDEARRERDAALDERHAKEQADRIHAFFEAEAQRNSLEARHERYSELAGDPDLTPDQRVSARLLASAHKPRPNDTPEHSEEE
jgi:hypothetical protein